jgi:hypothetical protein
LIPLKGEQALSPFKEKSSNYKFIVYTSNPMKNIFAVLLAIIFCSYWAYSEEANDLHSESNEAALSLNNDSTLQSKEQKPAPLQILESAATVLPMTQKEKFYFYLKTTYDPQSLFFSAASAGIQQARDSVPEWGQGMEGYSKRFASSFGQKVIDKTIVFGLGSILHEDPRYFRSEKSGVWRRVFHAVGQSFISHKDSGGIRPGYSSFIGMTAGVCISRKWYPASEQTPGEYFKDGAITFGSIIAKNIIHEFFSIIK